MLGWMWIACAITTIVLVGVTRAALKERQYSAVMAATGLLYLAILTAFGMDLVARAVLGLADRVRRQLPLDVDLAHAHLQVERDGLAALASWVVGVVGADAETAVVLAEHPRAAGADVGGEASTVASSGTMTTRWPTPTVALTS